MPAKNPRLTITLQPSLSVQLRRLSELTGNSQSAIIGDLLEGSGPVFDRMIQVLEAAKLAKDSMRGKLAGDIDKAQGRMEEALGIALDDFDNLTASLLDEAEAVPRRGVGKRSLPTAAAAPPTPPSNRGVRSQPQTPKKPTATKTYSRSVLKTSEPKKQAQKQVREVAK